MTDEGIPVGDGRDEDIVKREEIEALLRQVPPDEHSQIRAFALLQGYRREALLAIAACVDRRSKHQAVDRARERLKQNLIQLLDRSRELGGS